MNKKYLVIVLSIWALVTKPISFDFIKNLPARFSRKIDLASEAKDYPVKPHTTIAIRSDTGDIDVRTEANRSTVTIQAVKRAAKGTDVSHLRTHVQATDHELSICTVNNNPDVDAALDYMLVVPEQVSVQASTDSGTIRIERVQGKVVTTTKDGDIELSQIGNAVVAKATRQGSITIEQPSQKVQARTKKGSIIINDAAQSVIAATNHGHINVKSEQLKPNCALKLANHRGQINLALPKSGINADIKAHTKRGTITSEKEITIKQRTMCLDAGSWKEMQKNIEGSIGNPQEAQIVLSTKKGNIKITELRS